MSQSWGKAALEAACSGDTDKTREAVSEDAGPTCPSVDAYEFIDNFLPKVPEAVDTMKNVINWVKTESGEYANGRWKSFTKDPASYSQGEAVVFTKLCGIVNAIHNAVGKFLPDLHSKLQTRYYTRPSNAPETTFRYNLTRPDGYFVLDNERSRGKENPDWIDIAVTGEFKKSDGDAATADDVAKILWNMHHIFREDPRRRHTFGYTIENRTFRMWFASRSEIVVSTPIDFFKEPEYIIRFFFAFMYASPTEMGWDPTMKMIWDGDNHVEPQYEITVQSKEGLVRVFRTAGLISAVGAESIRGRGTRVWMVREVVEGDLDDQCYVLKDAWIDSDRMSEGDVIAQITADAKAELNETDQKRLKDCLLTTYISGDVDVEPGRRDETISGRKRTRLIKRNTRQFVLRASTTPTPTATPTPPSDATRPTKKGATVTRGGTGKPAGAHHDSGDKKKTGEKSIVYSSKVHYRIVFKEVCNVLHEIKSLEDITHALVKTCGALQILHKLGWVHRDISSGNLMMKGGQLKIADFEYAKKMTKPGGEVHDIRTGTEDFMSIEVRRQKYLFTTDKEEDDGDGGHVWDEVYGVATSEDVEDDTETQPRHTWFYNPLHDFESVFWLTLNFLTNKDFRCIADSPQASLCGGGDGSILGFLNESDAQRKQRIIAHWNFGRSIFAGRSGRADLLHSSMILTDFLSDHPLHPALAPLGKILINMRNALVGGYRRIEQNLSLITHQSAPEISHKFAAQLLRAYKHVKRIPCRIEAVSLKQAVDALPKSTDDGSRPSTSKGASAGSRAKRRRNNDDDEYVEGSQARKSKSPRTSASHKSPTSAPASTKGRKARGGKRKATNSKRASALRKLPTTAPFTSPTSQPAAAPTQDTPPPPPPSSPPPPPPQPPTRVLRSQTRNAVVRNPRNPPDPPPAAPTRKVSTAATGRKTRGAVRAKESAKAAAKVANKSVPKRKPRTRAARGS